MATPADTHAAPAAPARGALERKLGSGRAVAYAAGNLGTNLLPPILISWIAYLYAPPEDAGRTALIPIALFGWIRFSERIIGMVTDPLAGYLSDRTRSRLGRRIPYMLFGTPPLLVCFILLWFPPPASAGVPIIATYFGVNLVLFWLAYTFVVAPYFALLPEITPHDHERVAISVKMAYFEVAAMVVSGFGAGWAIETYSGGLDLGGFVLADGFKVTAIVAAIVAGASFLGPLLAIKETPSSEAPSAQALSFKAAVRASFANPDFLPYALGVGSYRVATNLGVIAIPYMTSVLMKRSETWAGVALGSVVIVSALTFPVLERLAHRYGKARVFRWGGIGFVLVFPSMFLLGLPIEDPLVIGLPLFVLAGVPCATTFVLPRALLADVIDEDEKRTSMRREAIYTGMSGFFEKMGDAVALLVSTQLFALFGYGAARPLGILLIGPAAGLFVAAGLLAFRRYRLG